MAKKSMIAKQQRTPKFAVRAYTRCSVCGRPHSVYRDFGLCRVCLRKMANEGYRVLGVGIAEFSGTNYPKTQQEFKLRVQKFIQSIVIYRRSNCVHHYWECTSIYRPLSYPCVDINNIENMLK